MAGRMTFRRQEVIRPDNCVSMGISFRGGVPGCMTPANSGASASLSADTSLLLHSLQVTT